MARTLSKLTLLLTVVATMLVGFGPSMSTAAVPASNNDPCAKAGRDTCGTTGVGAYHNYKYGLRWFGDYRNAIPGVSGSSFCIDLNFWFPGRKYNYKQRSTAGLKNKAGATVSPATLAKISYAIWNYGRSNSASQQGATMLFVHGQMNDAPAAQVAGNSIGKSVSTIYNRITSAADKYAGPYTLKVDMPASLNAGDSANATVQVVSASGHPVPNVSFNLDASGASAPATVTSGADGTASVSLTPSGAPETLKLTATATGLAADAPTMYAPTKGSTAANGQRLVVPASQTLSQSASTAVAQVTPTVSSSASPQTLNVGGGDTDQVTIGGLPKGVAPTVTDNLYGPFPSQAAITCTGTPAQSVQFTGANGTTSAPAVTAAQAGWYGFQVVVAGTADTAAVTSQCGVSSEDFQANLYSPNITSTATPANVNLGSSDADSVTLSGLPAGSSPTVTVNVYGPASSQSAISCSGTPIATETFSGGNGTFTAPSVTPSAVGWYGYQISVPATSQSNGVTSPCAPATESFQVTTQPTVHTQASANTVSPGSSLSDTVVVSGLHGQSATVGANLYGPFASPGAIKCTGTPVWSGSIPVSGDGTYQTAATTLSTPGYYVYNESIAAQGFVQPASTSCADTAETVVVTGTPAIDTKVSDTTIAPGSKLQDHAVVSGLGALKAEVHVDLWGPYSFATAMSCSGTPAWSGDFTANGDGTYLTKPATIKAVGYYVYQESIVATSAHAAVTTPCANAAETSLSKPAPVIHTIPSASVARPGTAIHDRIQVSGIGQSPVTIGVQLYGPFSTLSRLSCSGTPVWSGTVQASGDGSVDSGSFTIKKVGFYVYRETLQGSGLVPSVTTPCANLPETVLGEPEIITGPGVAKFKPNTSALTHPAGSEPTRISIPALHIAAPIGREAISIRTGQMAVPANIHHVGWWQDGAVPSDRTGTTLLAGHINWVHQGNGAFYELAMAGEGKRSVTGDLVNVRTANGKVYTYRISSVARMPKSKLPAGVFTRHGARKLVMVTCGGAYNAKTKHYVDNVVVTAVRV